MAYRNLPPGRLRGIEYYNSLLTRQRRIRPILNISPIRINRNLDLYHIDEYSFGNMDDFFSYERLSNLQNVKIGLLSKKILQNSKIVLNKKTDNCICVICQSEIQINDIVREISCFHKFHVDCIDTFFVDNKHCPLCRFDLSS